MLSSTPPTAEALRPSPHPPAPSEAFAGLRAGEPVADVEWLDADTIHMTVRGYASVAATVRNMRKLEALMEARVPRWVICDASAMTGFAPAARKPTELQFRHFRERGGEEVLLVTEDAMARMLAWAVSLVAGIPIRPMATMAEALAHVRSRRDG